jgi:hypothetical protein
LMKICKFFLSSTVNLIVYFCEFMIPLYMALLCDIIYHYPGFS